MTYDPAWGTGGGGPHAASHATGQSDAVSPASIGAADGNDLDALADTVTDHIAVAALDSELTAGLATKANTSHTHNASDVTAGLLATARGGTNADGSGVAANRVLASPDGSAGAVAYRALVDGDIPAAIARDSEVTSAIATHAGEADPHTVYQRESEKGAASGYASLSASTKVPIAEIPTGTTGTTVPFGNNARFSDARTPLAHNHNASDINAGTLVVARGGTGLAALGTALQYPRVNAGATALEYVTLGAFAERILNADQAAIGTTATVLTELTTALNASSKYRFRAVIYYTQVAAGTLHAGRVTYSGTLAAVANGLSMYDLLGKSGIPTVWAQAFRGNTQAINAAIPTTTGGLSAGAASPTIASFIIEGTIHTNAAGNLAIEVVSSAASGFIPKAGSRIQVHDITAAA